MSGAASGIVLSWSRIPRVRHKRILRLRHREEGFPALAPDETCLAHGAGRSYGDVCLNAGGVLMQTRGMDHFIHFDRASGALSCEAGVSLGEILNLVTPHGWFLPVTPGTRFVTMAGALANDVHGKNHHVAGTFGRHVRRFELLRSNGERLVCSPEENPGWFAATIGGLGLTGLVTWIEIQLLPIDSPWMITQAQRFRSLDEFWALSIEANAAWPYTVAWVDCTDARGKGLLFNGRHAPRQPAARPWREKARAIPVDPPMSLINTPSVRAFNTAYYHRPRPGGERVQHYAPFFYPLDAVRNWNRLYGRNGFHQYQCVIPPDGARAGIGALMKEMARAGAGSFLSVLKLFGDLPSPGLLSFPRAGATLSVDFPERGEATARLFANFDAIVREHGGALYPAKDSRMSGAMFRGGYPQVENFRAFVDPKFSSGFWRRVQES